MPSITLTLNAAAANLEAAPIGVSVAISESSSWLSVAEVTHELTRPPRSLATLATTGAIMSAPFDNAFTPDVPGNYRVRTIATFLDGSTAEATRLVRVRMPYAVNEDETIPAPLEELEENGTLGWSDQVNRSLELAHNRYSGAEWVTVYNNTGGTLTGGTIVELDGLTLWPTLTGGTLVIGSPRERVATPSVPAGSGASDSTFRNVALVTEDIEDGAKGRVLQRGLIYESEWWDLGWNIGDKLTARFDTKALSASHGQTTHSPPVAQVVASNVLWFDPRLVGALAKPHLYELAMTDGASNQALTGLVWSYLHHQSVLLWYEVTRGATPDVESGLMILIFTASGGVVTQLGGDTGTAPGVTFSIQQVVNSRLLLYSLTSTGDDATLRVRVLEETTPV